jgi:hypothetical protein
MSIETLECFRCGHIWIQRREGEPRICPKCKSHLWKIPKVVRGTTIPLKGTYNMDNGTVCDEEMRTKICDWRGHKPGDIRTTLCIGCDF